MDKLERKQARRAFLKRFWKKQQTNLIAGLIIGEIACVILYRYFFPSTTVLGYVLALLVGVACFGIHMIYLYHFYRREEERLEDAKNNRTHL